MRKILILIMLISFISLISLITPASGVRHEIYTNATPSDEGVYLFFSKLLKDAGNCLDNFIDENANAVNLSVSLEHKIRLAEEENRLYTARGVKSNVSLVIKPFISLSDGIERLTRSQSIFLKEIELLSGDKNNRSAYIAARTAVMNMRLAADEINGSLSDIEQIELWNETSKLQFDVSELRSKLKDVYDLIAYYESLLARFEVESITSPLLVVAVSNAHPFLHQEITIYVYARNVTRVVLFIDDVGYELNQGYMKYSFEELGEHTIYAVGVGKGKSIKSNVVKVYVSKIPSHIVLTSEYAAFLNESVEVKGFLSDYYGNPLNANVTARIDSEESELPAKNGFFSFNVTRASEGFLTVSAFYAGNETYKGSNASISIFFSRFPTSLHIEADKTKVSVNETVNFTGRIYGVNYPISYASVYIIVNSTNIETLNVTESFNFTLNFLNPGKYVVSAYFPGDPLHKPAESNRIEISVVSALVPESPFSQPPFNQPFSQPTYLYYLLLLLVFAIVLGVYLRKKRSESESEIEHPEEKKEIKEKEMEETGEVEETDVPEVAEETREPELPKSVEEAYNLLFNALVSKFNLKRSLTPREVLKVVKDEKLKVVTELHERAVYGKTQLEDEERKVYFRFIAEMMEGLG